MTDAAKARMDKAESIVLSSCFLDDVDIDIVVRGQEWTEGTIDPGERIPSRNGIQSSERICYVIGDNVAQYLLIVKLLFVT